LYNFSPDSEAVPRFLQKPNGNASISCNNPSLKIITERFSVMIPISATLPRIAAQSSVISTFRCEKSRKQRNNGTLFRYFVVATGIQANTVLEFRYPAPSVFYQIAIFEADKTKAGSRIKKKFIDVLPRMRDRDLAEASLGIESGSHALTLSEVKLPYR
jgi:hypothetical protein